MHPLQTRFRTARPNVLTALLAVTLTLAVGASGFARPARTGSTPPNSDTLMSVDGMAAPANAKADLKATPQASMPLHLTFALASDRLTGLEAFIDSQHNPKSANYRHWLTPDQFGQRFGAADADLNAVLNYMRSQGLKVTHVWPNHLFLSADTTVSQAEKVFGVKIQGYSRVDEEVAKGAPRNYFAPDRAPRVPADIAARLRGVYGMSTFVFMHRLAAHKAQEGRPDFIGSLPIGGSSGPPNGGGSGGLLPQFSQPLAPADISKVYDVNDIHALGLYAQSWNIGVFSPTLHNDSDIYYFGDYYSLYGYNLYHSIIDGGPDSYYDQDAACLDAEIIIGQATGCNLIFYEPPNNGTLDAWNQIAADNYSVLSNSWAIDELYLHVNGFDGYVYNWENILAEMDAQGMSHFNSSGDNGAFNYYSNAISINLPGSSPHVTTVGGTSLFGDGNGNWSSETGWSYSGGGLSIYWPRPSWQSGPGVQNGYSDGYRQTPDVAAAADPNTPGYWVYFGGQWYQYGGTSASAPLWASVNLLINQGLGERTSNLDPALYFIGANLNALNNAFVFHDITSGYNGYYSCTSSWDYVTGWGSATFWKLFADIVLLPNLVPYNPGSGGPGGNWTSPIMIHANANSVTEPSTFVAGKPYYFAIAVADLGSADALPCQQSLYIDGAPASAIWGPFASNYYDYNLQFYSTTLTAGTHTISLTVNSNNAIQETTTADNTYTRTIYVQSSGPTVQQLLLSQTSVIGGSQNSTGTVILSANAPSGGAVVNLSSSDTTGATVQSSVKVPAGSNSASFPIYSQIVSTTRTPVITASYNGSSQSATLTVTPLLVQSLSLNPSTVVGGSSSTGTVTLNGPVLANATIGLSSSSNSATVPSTLTVYAGLNTASFTINTQPVTITTTAAITASFNGASQSSALTITPANNVTLSSVSVSPSTVIGGGSGTVTVTLSGAAPSGGVTVSVSTNSPAVQVQSSLFIAAGSSSGSLSYTTSPVTSNKSVNVKAVLNGATVKTTLTVLAPTLAALTLNPSTVKGGSNVTCTVTLTGNTAAATTVTLINTNPAARAPASVTIAKGASSKSVTITTSKPSGSGNATGTVTAKLAGKSLSQTLTVTH
jgi:hypothetical protein